VFDHVLCFKGMSGAPFVLTMPYATPEVFYRSFNQLADRYYREKSNLADSMGIGYGKEYRTENWGYQFRTPCKMMAIIVPDRFKVRENGDFAAIIATDHWLLELSRLGGFTVAEFVEGDGDG